MIGIHKQLLCANQASTHRTVQIPTKDGTITAMDGQVLVRWKGGFNRRRAAEVGDGMELIRVFERPFMTYGLDHAACGEGVTIYREFDEEKAAMRSYLYGYGTDQQAIETTNEILHSVGSPLHIARVDNFVECLGHTDLEHACVLVRLGGWKVLYSFVFGLFLGYGKFVGDQSTLHHAVIQIPMVGSIPTCEDTYKNVIHALRDRGVVIRSSYSTHRSHQVRELGIYDWELLFHLQKRTEGVLPYTSVARWEQMKTLKSDLLVFLDNSHASSSCITTVKKSVVKLHEVQFS